MKPVILPSRPYLLLGVPLLLLAMAGFGGRAAEARPSEAPPGVSLGPVAPRGDIVPEKMVALASTIAGVVDDHDDVFASSSYNAATERFEVSANSPEGVDLLRESGIDVSDIDVSNVPLAHRALMAAGERVVDQLAKARSILRVMGVNRSGTGLYLEVSQEPTEDQVAEFASATRGVEFPVSIEVQADLELPDQRPVDDNRRVDQSPYYGGFAYAAAVGAAGTVWGRCSGGFSYSVAGVAYMSTAGHCFYKNTPRDEMFAWQIYYANLGQHAGNWTNRTTWEDGVGTVLSPDGQYHGDLSIVNVESTGHQAAPRIWRGGQSTTGSEPVQSRSAPAVGTYVCKGGATTGDEGCLSLEVRNVNVNWYDPNSPIVKRAIDIAHDDYGYCSEPGDSGGPIFRFGIVAVGIISGHTDYAGGGCQQRFTGMEEAVQLWGGNVKFAP